MKKGYYSLPIFLIILCVLIGYLTISYFTGDRDNSIPFLPTNAHTIRVIEDKRDLINLPLYLAISKGLFTEANLEVILSTAVNGEEPLEITKVTNNSVLYLCGPEEMIYLYQINQKAKLKYFYNLSHREGSLIISKDNTPNFSIDMMQKKSIIGSPRGSLREMVLEKFLHDNNLIPQRSINIIQTLTYPDNMIAFNSDSSDFIQITEPEASQMVTKGIGFKKVSLANKMKPMLNKGLIASIDYISQHSKDLNSLTKVMYTAQLWIQYMPIEAYINQIKKYYPNYTINELTKGIENYKNSSVWTTDPTPTEEEFKVLQNVMDSAGELRKQLPPNLFLEKKFTLKAIKEIKKEDIISSNN